MYVIGKSFFGKSFLLYVITKRHCFKKPYCYPELLFNPHVVAFFEADVLKEIRTSFFLSSTITVQCNTKVPKWSPCISYLLQFSLRAYKSNVFKNSKPYWKHVFCNMIFMFFQVVVIIWRYKGKTKSQHLAPTYIALQSSIQQKTWHLPV